MNAILFQDSRIIVLHSRVSFCPLVKLVRKPVCLFNESRNLQLNLIYSIHPTVVQQVKY